MSERIQARRSQSQQKSNLDPARRRSSQSDWRGQKNDNDDDVDMLRLPDKSDDKADFTRYAFPSEVGEQRQENLERRQNQSTQIQNTDNENLTSDSAIMLELHFKLNFDLAEIAVNSPKESQEQSKTLVAGQYGLPELIERDYEGFPFDTHPPIPPQELIGKYHTPFHRDIINLAQQVTAMEGTMEWHIGRLVQWGVGGLDINEFKTNYIYGYRNVINAIDWIECCKENLLINNR